MSRFILGLSVLLLGLPGARVARGEDLPPPPMRRAYEGRVNLYQGEPTNREPKRLSADQLKESTLPKESAAPFADTPINLDIPRTGPPGDPARRGEREREPKSWLNPKAEPEAKPSGWGWLADEINKSPTTLDVEADPFSDADPEDNPDPGQDPDKDEPDNTREKKKAPEVWGAGRSGRGEQSLETTSEVGWRPVQLDDEEGEQRRIEVAEEEGKGTGFNPDRATGFTFKAPDLVDVDANRLRGTEVDRTGREWSGEAVPGQPGGPQDTAPRSLFRPVDIPAERSLYTPAPDPYTPSAGRLATPSLSGSDGGGGNQWSPAGSTPSFSSLGAVQMSPSLSQPAPISSALTLPSQPPAPSVGGMGRDLDVRPKTLPW